MTLAERMTQALSIVRVGPVTHYHWTYRGIPLCVSYSDKTGAWIVHRRNRAGVHFGHGFAYGLKRDSAIKTAEARIDQASAACGCARENPVTLESPALRAGLIVGAATLLAVGVYAFTKSAAQKAASAPAPSLPSPDFRRGGTAAKGPEVVQVTYDPVGPYGVYISEA